MDYGVLKLKRLEKGCAKGRMDMRWLLGQCQLGNAMFFDVEQACAVAQVIPSGENRICMVLVVAGTMDGVREIEPMIVEYARENGCQAVQMIGRPGWERVYNTVASGYRPIGTLYEKALEG